MDDKFVNEMIKARILSFLKLRRITLDEFSENMRIGIF